MIIDRNKTYIIEGRDLVKLKELEQRLYKHDMEKMTADETRDWANWLNQCLFYKIDVYEDILYGTK